MVINLEGQEKIFNNCKFKGLTIQNRADKIVLYDCSFLYFEFEIEQVLSGIKIDNCSAESIRISGKSNVSLREIIISGADSHIGKLDFNGSFYCIKITLDGIKAIEKSTLELNCNNFDLINAENIEYIVISGEVKKQLNIKKCNNLEFFVIKDLKAERIECSDSTKLDVQLETLEIKYINFTRCNDTSLETAYLIADHIGFSEGSFKKIQFYHGCNFNLKARSLNQSLLKVQSLIFAASHIAKDRTMNFEDVILEKITIDGIHNEGLIHFLSCDISKELQVFKSNQVPIH